MNRLTARDEHGNAYYPECFKEPRNGGGCTKDMCDFTVEACNKLAAYEDTGLVPEQLSVIDDEYSKMAKELAELRKDVSVNGGDKMKHKEIGLKPCPFCGRPATTSEIENIQNLPFGWGWVGCQPCHVHIDWSHGDRGKKLAFEAWNRRSDDGLSGSD